MTDPIKVLLVDDHEVVRTGYRLLLSQSKRVNEVIEAETGEQAYQMYFKHQPQAVVMDLSLPGMSGLACIRKIISRDPLARILVFSIHDEPVYVTRALEAGAKGYITKSSASEMLVEAVYCVAQGEQFIEPDIQQRISAEKPTAANKSILSELSAREFEVFCLIAKGYTAQEVANTLFLSVKTVANYSTHIKAKLNVKTTSELTRLAYQYGVFAKEND